MARLVQSHLNNIDSLRRIKMKMSTILFLIALVVMAQQINCATLKVTNTSAGPVLVAIASQAGVSKDIYLPEGGSANLSSGVFNSISVVMWDVLEKYGNVIISSYRAKIDVPRVSRNQVFSILNDGNYVFNKKWYRR